MRTALPFTVSLPLLRAEVYNLECEDIESNNDFITCKALYQDEYLECSTSCQSDPSCVSQCSRIYDENLKSCPCQEYCPNSCPCPTYECMPKFDDECGQIDSSLNWFSFDHQFEDGSIAKKCFSLVEERRPTQEAEDYCNEHNNGNLLSVHNQNQWDAVMRAVRSQNTPANVYWIGYMYEFLEDEYGWTDGSPIDFENFTEGYPGEPWWDHDAAYIDVNLGKWKTKDQLISHYFVCQMWPNSMPVNK